MPSTDDLAAAVSSLSRQLIRTQQRVCELQMESLLRSLNKAPALPIQFTSQYGEDAYLWELFAGQPTGFFIEAGAFDGFHYSVTYPFEAYGWTGLCVEPIPETAAACAARRKHSRVVHAALDESVGEGEIELKIVQDPYGGMLSHTSENAPAVRELRRPLPSRRVSVPRATLDALLADHAGPIDLVSLDVEGAEERVLRGFDVARFKPRVMIVECDPQAIGSMLGGDYVHVAAIESAQVFVRSNERQMLEWCRWKNL